MIYIKNFESYEYEDFSLSDMDFVLDLWNDGLSTIIKIIKMVQ